MFGTVAIKLLKSYSDYRKDRRKEDDLLVRQYIQSELTKAGERTVNIQVLVAEGTDKKLLKTTKSVKNELDQFLNEAKLGLAGHSYPLLSIQHVRSPSAGDIKKLVEFDEGILERVSNVATASQIIETKVRDGDASLDLDAEMRRLLEYLTVARGLFKDREQFLRSWK